MDAPHLTLQQPRGPAGAYWVGGMDSGLSFPLMVRPRWWHRLFMRWAFGWVWVDGWAP